MHQVNATGALLAGRVLCSYHSCAPFLPSCYMAIVSLSDAKLFLGIAVGDTSEDDKLTFMIGMVDRIIKNYCRQNLEQATYTEFFSGDGTRAVVLRQRPIQSITNVWLDNSGYYGTGPSAFASTALLTSGTGYAPDWDITLSNAQVVSKSGLLIRIGTIWPELNAAYIPGRLTQETGPAYGNIKVTYVAGYPSAAFPADLKGAACMLVSGMRRSAIFGGMPLSSESITDYSYSLAAVSVNKFPEIGTVRQILNGYREVPLGSSRAASPAGTYGR